MRMILADDEPVITTGIQKLIDWKRLGIEIVGVYEDGKSAFEAIIKNKPELALLDISMPGMTGIEILRECHLMKLSTKIIFVSGFQDFEYAKDSVKYGAVDYLLKPIIRDELIAAVEKCIPGEEDFYTTAMHRIKAEKDLNYADLVQVEDAEYLPVLVMLQIRQVDEQMRKLLCFSFESFLEPFMQRNNYGISFVKDGNIILIFKQIQAEECRVILEELRESVISTFGQEPLFIMGECVRQLSDISAAYEECLEMKGYLFFSEELRTSVLEVGRTVFGGNIEQERLEKIKEEIVMAVVNNDFNTFEQFFIQYRKLVCRIAKGKKDDACYYFCTMVRAAEERLIARGFRDKSIAMNDLLEIGRAANSYFLMAQAYKEILICDIEMVRQMAENLDGKSFIIAKEYIEKHYAENLTLNVLADVVHMNPYYFSAFFKKNSGENFKTYLSMVRMEHAVRLLVTTDKKTSEIAMEIGFSDARIFSKAFQKYYHETPNEYRKRMRK